MDDENSIHSGNSSDNEQEQEHDEMMEDVDDMDADNDAEEDENEEDAEQDAEQDEDEAEPDQDDTKHEAGGEAGPDATARVETPRPRTADDAGNGTGTGTATATAESSSSTSANTSLPYRPEVRPEALAARLYDIVPTMAAPMATSINALAVTPDLRYFLTGGTDGYIRKFDGIGTCNGKLPLTVAQRHPFVDSVHKAGILMSYWENFEPPVTERVFSPVYSLAVRSNALWCMSGLESGGIALHSLRYDEGKRITTLQKHSNAVSVLTLAQDEKSVLSGSWDKNILDWDLNTGEPSRQFDGSGGQISAIELRPASGAPIPFEASLEAVKSETFSSNSGRPVVSGLANGVSGVADVPPGPNVTGTGVTRGATGDAASPAHESLFGGSDDAGSLFGGGGAFGDGGEDDDEFSRAMAAPMDGDAVQDADASMMDMDMSGGGGGSFGGDSTAPAGPQAADAAVGESSNDNLANGGASQVPGTDENFSLDALVSQDQADATQHPPSAASQDPPVPDQQFQQTQVQQEAPPTPSMLLTHHEPAGQHDPTQTSDSTFFSAAIDGTIRLWDRRVARPVARIDNRPGVPPWCMGACWSPDGNTIFAGRRNGTVEEFSVHRATSSWVPERTLKFPAGSGAVSAVRAMPNGRHLVCASHDILRLYDLGAGPAFKGSSVPFLVVPGPPRAGVIAALYVDPTSRVMLSIAGNRGWEGTCTEHLIGYEINVS